MIDERLRKLQYIDVVQEVYLYLLQSDRLPLADNFREAYFIDVLMNHLQNIDGDRDGFICHATAFLRMAIALPPIGSLVPNCKGMSCFTKPSPLLP
jgi:hypothetical protein